MRKVELKGEGPTAGGRVLKAEGVALRAEGMVRVASCGERGAGQ